MVGVEQPDGLLGARRGLLPRGWRTSRLSRVPGGAATSSFTEDAISKETLKMLLSWIFLYFFFFFCHSCLVLNTLGGCYKSHGRVGFLRAWGCEETGWEQPGVRFSSPSDPCWVLGLCQPLHSTRSPVTAP